LVSLKEIKSFCFFAPSEGVTSYIVVHRHFLWSRSRAGAYNYIFTFLCAIA